MRKLTLPSSKSPLNTPKLSTVGNKVMTNHEQMTHFILTIQNMAQAAETLDETSLGLANLLVTSSELRTIADNHTQRLEALERRNLAPAQKERAIQSQIKELTDKISSYVSTIYITTIDPKYLRSLVTDCENELNTLILACEPFVNTDANRTLLIKWRDFFHRHSTTSDITQRQARLTKAETDRAKFEKKTKKNYVRQVFEMNSVFSQEHNRRANKQQNTHIPTPQADYLAQHILLVELLDNIDSQIRYTPNQYQTLRSAYFEACKVLTVLDKQYPLRLDGQGLHHIPETVVLHKLTTVCSKVRLGLQFVRQNTAFMQCNPVYNSQANINYDRAEHTRNMAALHSLADELKGHGFKKLGNFLIGFALMLLIITGILACIPSGGSSLLAVVGSFSGIHTLGGVTALTNMIQAGTTLSAGSAATLSTAAGFTSIAGVIGGLGMFARKDQGLARAVHSVKMNLSQPSASSC